MEGRLKVQLDSDGEEEEDGETHAERNARIRATAQVSCVPLTPSFVSCFCSVMLFLLDSISAQFRQARPS